MYQSKNIINRHTPIIQKEIIGIKIKEDNEIMWPREAPRHLAQNGIGEPFSLKHLSGIPWHPNVIYLNMITNYVYSLNKW